MDDSDPVTVPMEPFDSPDDVGDRTAFDDALDRLIRAAEANGLDVEGGFRSVGEEGDASYGIEIYRVVRRTD